MSEGNWRIGVLIDFAFEGGSAFANPFSWAA